MSDWQCAVETLPLLELQRAITRAVLRARSLGYCIAAGAFIDFDLPPIDAPDEEIRRWCCPLGAVALSGGCRATTAESERSASVVVAAIRVLGVSFDWVWSFADGFDAIDLSPSGRPYTAPFREGHQPIQEAFDLGRWWRDRIDHPELGLPGEEVVEFPGQQLPLFVSAAGGAS